MLKPIFILGVFLTAFAFSSSQASTAEYSPLKSSALKVLKKRCNSCHILRNPTMVFTANNMNAKAPRIYTQVFDLKRMPKGKRELTEAERASLFDWLETLNYNTEK